MVSLYEMHNYIWKHLTSTYYFMIQSKFIFIQWVRTLQLFEHENDKVQLTK